MTAGLHPNALLLVLDTCGERASLALFGGSGLLDQAELEERTASASLLGSLGSMLVRQGARVQDLGAIGVVSGPGSFTGVRVGMAMAKGLCEAAVLEFAAVSRLQVLAEAANCSRGFALLPAGRDQVFALDIAQDREWLTSLEQLAPLLEEQDVAVSSEQLAQTIASGRSVRVVQLSAIQALGLVLRKLAKGGTALAGADANYVRNEEAIYRAAGAAR